MKTYIPFCEVLETDFIFDASGVNDPHSVYWYELHGIYYPLIKCLECNNHIVTYSCYCPKCEDNHIRNEIADYLEATY